MNPLTSLCTRFAVLPGLHLWRCQLHAEHSSLYTCCPSAQFCLCNQSKAEDSLPWGEQRLPGLSAAQGLPQLPQRAMKRFCWTPGSREPDRQVAGRPDAQRAAWHKALCQIWHQLLSSLSPKSQGAALPRRQVLTHAVLHHHEATLVAFEALTLEAARRVDTGAMATQVW